MNVFVQVRFHGFQSIVERRKALTRVGWEPVILGDLTHVNERVAGAVMFVLHLANRIRDAAAMDDRPITGPGHEGVDVFDLCMNGSEVTHGDYY